jgi:hypothetical protein
MIRPRSLAEHPIGVLWVYPKMYTYRPARTAFDRTASIGTPAYKNAFTLSTLDHGTFARLPKSVDARR